MDALVARLEAVASRLEAASGAPPGAPPASSPAASASAPASGSSVSAFADLVDGPLRALTDRAAPLGAEVADATALFASCFEAELAVLCAVAACAKPSAEALSTLLAPVGAALTALAMLLSSASCTAIFCRGRAGEHRRKCSPYTMQART